MPFWQKLFFWRQSPGFDSAMRDEIAFHIEERVEELVRGGLDRSTALRTARLEFGPAARVVENSRAEWQFQWLEDLASDIRFSLRGLRRDRAFALAAIASLAVGTGVNTAIFSLTMEFLFSRPSVRDVSTLAYARLGGNSHTEYRHYQYLRDMKVFPDVMGMREFDEVNWRVGEETRRLHAILVTGNAFEMAGIPVAAGRGFQPGEENVVVLSHRFWQARLAGRQDIVGDRLILDGRPHTVTGILPDNHRSLFGYGLSPDLYLPVRPGSEPVALYLRLPAGISMAAARDRLTAAAAALDAAHPQHGFRFTNNVEVRAAAGWGRATQEMSIAAFFGLLFVVGTLVMAIACVNVSGLLLARASSRAHEIAIRAGLGAGRGRLIRQLLTEILILAAFGTAAGCFLNLLMMRLLNSIQLDLPVTLALRVEPDWRLLAYAAIVVMLCAILAGVLPAWRLSNAQPGTVLKSRDHQVSRGQAIRRLLVGGQVAVSVIVLTAALLFTRNLVEAIGVNPGFDLDRIIVARVRIVPHQYADAPLKEAAVANMKRALESVPGVSAAVPVMMVPFNDDATRGGLIKTDLSNEPIRVAHHFNRVGPDYFRVIGVDLLAGREFNAQDSGKGQSAIVVNEPFARAAFGNRNPVGHTIEIHEQKRTIIGVVREAKYASLGDNARPAVFEPYAPTSGSRSANIDFVVRSEGALEPLVRPLQLKLGAIDPAASIDVRPMRRAMSFALLPSQVGAALLGAMGWLGLILTAVGVYGLLAYSVTQRIREIGLRMALGAAPLRVVLLVIAEGAWLVTSGALLGLVAAYFVTQPLARFLVPELKTSDPLTYAGVLIILIFIGTAASLGPVRKALRIQPLEALRHE